MGRMISHNEYTVNRLPFSEIVEGFGDTLESIYRRKRSELLDDLLPYYESLDAINNSNHSDGDKYLMQQILISNYHQPLKAIEHIRKVRNMRIRNKEGRMSNMPVEQVKCIPILDVFEFTTVKRTGRRTMVSCIFHDDRKPSAIINSNNTYKCFSCGFAGDVISLTQKLYGFDFVSAVKKLQGDVK